MRLRNAHLFARVILPHIRISSDKFAARSSDKRVRARIVAQFPRILAHQDERGSAWRKQQVRAIYQKRMFHIEISKLGMAADAGGGRIISLAQFYLFSI